MVQTENPEADMKKLITALMLLPLPAWADDPVIEAVRTQQSGSGWSVSVTLLHPDSGWDHYADGWEVLDANGNSLGHRVLAHPHVNEQPFTRSLSGISIPTGTNKVFVRAHCLLDGWGDHRFEVLLEN